MASMGIGSRDIITDVFFPELESAFDNSFVGKLIGGSPMKSTQQTEEHRFLTSVPPMSKWTGQRNLQRLQSKKIIVTNETWTTGLNIPIDDKRRQKGSQIEKRIAELAVQAAEFFAAQVSALLNAGGAATYGLAYDGQYYFDTDHVNGKSGTLKNDVTYSDIPALDFNAVANPTEVEMSQAIFGLIAWLFGMKNDQGQPMNGPARNFLVQVPIRYLGAANAARSNSVLAGASGATTSNALMNAGFNIDVVCNPRLTAVDQIIVARTDGPTPPIIVQEEVPLTIDELAEGSEYAQQNREHTHTVEWTGGFGYGQWEHIVRGTCRAD